MTTIYNNVPSNLTSKDFKILAYDTYYTKPLELDSGVYDSMKGFFTARGFDEHAAESTTIIIITQAKKDGYNPMQILDTLRGISNVEISALVSEILNYNRLKTSFLGYAKAFTPNTEITRNIIA